MNAPTITTSQVFAKLRALPNADEAILRAEVLQFIRRERTTQEVGAYFGLNKYSTSNVLRKLVTMGLARYETVSGTSLWKAKAGAAMTPDMLTPLDPFRQPSVERDTLAVVSPRPDHCRAGIIGSVRFVVTLDKDGHCEVSLSAEKERLTAGHVRAFFRKIGLNVPDALPTLINNGRAMHWVLPKAVQA